ncbi:ABC transporter ATP-binding protein [Staphylococcus simiae]|uniref:ABC transporter ATP-binding protein n=1 Tax=Staphylococcus simiae TaxID=308354 RepID=UPI001A9635C7|nr:ABC transporter ATP-binding protein [Staphylococcus simiae]MBO1198709.1 ABC transporter ATP-binding protein [Staphylococcus simiae]MBO1200961.1 ABC transporter ATP-binding protein [Staphylococcus simiae]MBO1203194.1 ABC transporter ATP-binding protein [Staphylococcus simiae]MBO1210698.1 ABC transporter ATP-binding protein [Staphylococcus simiae]MBO1229299.1 ABC transporter ATP-binding protein [Staphylococcus simiae]
MVNITARLKHANKSYNKQPILKDISIEVAQGQILGLIGPSGSGKTTTIKCLLGMEKLDSGQADIFGQRIPNRQILSRIGYMGQTDALYSGLTAKENLTFFGKLSGLHGQSLTTAINSNLEFVQLTNALNKTVSTFSGGMKRRLSLAIALLQDPDLIILDEPTVGIDPSLRQSIWQQLTSFAQQGKSIIVTTHVMDEAERCDQVGLIIDGQLFALGSPDDLKQQFNAHTIAEVFLKAEEGEES